MEHAPLSLHLAPTLEPIVETLRDPVAGLRAIADAGFRSVQLSGMIPSMRARELDRSARRDVLARMRRLELSPAGIDLWIPPKHFNEPDHADRATAALLDTIELAADFGAIPVSIELTEALDDVILEAVIDRAQTCGVTIADFARHDALRFQAPDVFGSGLDPAVEIGADRDPIQSLARLDRIASARFSDADAAGRITPGRGQLDTFAYRAALVTFDYQQPVVLDLRRLREPMESMAISRDAWERCGTLGAGG